MTREEAIEMVRKSWPISRNIDLRKALEILIPELAENEDERIRKDIIAFIKAVACKTAISEERESKWIAYLEKQKEQRPTEWNKKDEETLENLYELIRFGFTEKFFDAQTTTDVRNWINTRLKSLRPQPKEEDCDYITPNKEFFQWIYDRLIHVHKENPDMDYMRSFKKRINNLSFENRHHWKPSEEQLDALQYVKQFDYGGHKAALESLYKQLKRIVIWH